VRRRKPAVAAAVVAAGGRLAAPAHARASSTAAKATQSAGDPRTIQVSPTVRDALPTGTSGSSPSSALLLVLLALVVAELAVVLVLFRRGSPRIAALVSIGALAAAAIAYAAA
jgi:hypothetical protein